MSRLRCAARLFAVVAVAVVLGAACSGEDPPTVTGESSADADADTDTDSGADDPAEAADPDEGGDDGGGGTDPGDVDPGPTVDPGIEVPAEAEAYCTRSFEAAQRDGLGFAPTPEEVEAYYTALVDDLSFLADNAPPEVADAVRQVASVFDEVVTIVADAGYDMEVAASELEAFGSDPDREALMDDAIARLEAFDVDVCGIEY